LGELEVGSLPTFKDDREFYKLLRFPAFPAKNDCQSIAAETGRSIAKERRDGLRRQKRRTAVPIRKKGIADRSAIPETGDTLESSAHRGLLY